VLLVTCRIGGEHIWIAPEDTDRDPHRRLDAAGCSHCADSGDHHHGENADLCPKAHEGPCWQGSGPRPDGCAVCRPVTIEVPRGTVAVGPVG
jgi:hypothetical protein